MDGAPGAAKGFWILDWFLTKRKEPGSSLRRPPSVHSPQGRSDFARCRSPTSCSSSSASVAQSRPAGSSSPSLASSTGLATTCGAASSAAEHPQECVSQQNRQRRLVDASSLYPHRRMWQCFLQCLQFFNFHDFSSIFCTLSPHCHCFCPFLSLRLTPIHQPGILLLFFQDLCTSMLWVS